MSSMLLLEWIGGLDEDLLARSEQTAVKHRPRIIPWIASAACLCLVCGLAWGIFGSQKKATDNASGGVPEQEGPLFGNGILADSQTNSSLHDPESEGLVTEPYGYPCQSQSYFALCSMEKTGVGETVVFFSRQELDAWLDTLSELDALDRQKLLQLCMKYDAAYFNSQALLLTPVGMQDGYTDYRAGTLYVGVGNVQTDWVLYLYESTQEIGVDAEGCLYVFSAVEPNCTIKPGDTVGTLLVSQDTP